MYDHYYNYANCRTKSRQLHMLIKNLRFIKFLPACVRACVTPIHTRTRVRRCKLHDFIIIPSPQNEVEAVARQNAKVAPNRDKVQRRWQLILGLTLIKVEQRTRFSRRGQCVCVLRCVRVCACLCVFVRT